MTTRSIRSATTKAAAVLAVVLVAASCAAAAGPHTGWAKYSIAPGAHSATVDANGGTSPIAGLTSVSSRTFKFFFDSSAKYVITEPTQPSDQFDYNKLPGFSDCGDIDLSKNGAMFGWRWRLDTNPKRLEVVQYANNNGTHLYPSAPLLSLSEAEVDGEHPARAIAIIADTHLFLHQRVEQRPLDLQERGDIAEPDRPALDIFQHRQHENEAGRP